MTSSTPIVRFAPSPTGKLHVGNVRTALMNVLFARGQDGKFVLRIDDTDLERSTKAFEDGLKTDLKWLGLDWDDTFNQSARFSQYEAAAGKLREAGLLYACFETPEELDKQRKLRRAQGQAPIYNRAALGLSDDDRAALESQGRKPHWRFKLSGESASWTDLVRGDQSIDTGSISDPILIRDDGSFLYTLPSVVDDIDAKITHVIRGEDHVTNSGAQIEIFEALGGPVPQFAHTPLLVGADGKSLSKRLGSLSMDQLRDQGLEPTALLSLLGKIGTSDPVEAKPSLDILIDEFSFDKIGRAPARFDEAELALVNARYLHDLPYKSAKPRLAEMGADHGEAFWTLVRANIEKFRDVAGWAKTLYAPMQGQIDDEDVEFCKEAADCLPEKITDETWGIWTSELKSKTGRKGRGLFMPLRKALTGRQNGPAMDEILLLLGHKASAARLRGEKG
ncbi:glutamate--tRNA ligase [Robiginitomaculum antarcticum]|uniref:glutamate--tRNA ligase n=1 Tax=Robiginitomaculum antarcticum TaxID=437507 RepID=UPI00036F7ECB|nr:glutamate--tRNA ligase [Robiginitomaculum antarcticum]